MLAAAMVSWLKVVKARQVSPTWSIKVALTQCRLASVAVARLAPKPPRLVRAAATQYRLASVAVAQYHLAVAVAQYHLAVAVARLAPKPPRLVRAARLLPLVALQRVPIARSIISRWTGAHFSGIQGTNA